MVVSSIILHVEPQANLCNLVYCSLGSDHVTVITVSTKAATVCGLAEQLLIGLSRGIIRTLYTKKITYTQEEYIECNTQQQLPLS